MKKSVFGFVLLAALGMVNPLKAQQQGDMVITGSLGMGGNSTHYRTKFVSPDETIKDKEIVPGTFRFSIMPEFGYYVLDRLEVSLALGYDLERSDAVDQWQGKNCYDFTHLFTINPGISYHLPICEKFYYAPAFYLSVGFGSVNSQSAGRNGIEVAKEGFTSFGFGLALLSFEIEPTEHFAISLSAGDFTYALVHAKEVEESELYDSKASSHVTVNNVDFGLNLGAKIGFKYYF